MKKPKPKPKERTARVLNNTAGAWLPLGHSSIPPAVTTKFGAPRFSPQQQVDNPTLPMTRLVKDVLRTGSWKVGFNAANQPLFWDVEASTLNRILACYQLGQSRGIAMNLTKSHGDLTTGIVPTDDLISPIDQIAVDNGVLWISTYVTPDQVAYLTNPACKVSPYVMSNWMDGLGNVYPEMMLHVTVTDQPVQPGQGPFVAMANSQANGETNMDFEQIKALFNRLMIACGGKALPDSVDETNFITIATILVDMMAGEESAEEEPADVTEGDPVIDPEATPIAMSNKAPAWARGLITTVKSLSSTVGELKLGTVAQNKSAYSAKVLSLASAGKITPAQRTVLEQQGAACGYALSNLQVFDLNEGKPNGGRAARALGNAQEPAVEGGKKVLTDEEHAADLAKRGLKPVAIS